MTIKIQNQNQHMIIAPERGALITSWSVKGRELLFLPNNFSSTETSWPSGGIPTCFPFAGRVWNNGQLYQYELAGKEYPMPLHGFAFGLPWNILTKNEDKITLSLKSSDKTIPFYPFEFELQMTIILEDYGQTRFHFRICHLNSDFDSMPVALGLHPYFATLAKQTHLKISANTYYPVTAAGSAGKASDTKSLPNQNFFLDCSHPLLHSLIFSEFNNLSGLINIQDDVSIEFSSPVKKDEATSSEKAKFNHCVVWTNDIAKFYCVEPWMSLPDAVALSSGAVWIPKTKSIELDFSLKATI